MNNKFENNNQSSLNKKWYTPSGRIGRLQFFCYTMSVIALFLTVMRVLYVTATATGLNSTEWMLIFYSAGIAALYTLLIYSIRRLNDMNRTGYFVIIFCIPYVNIAFCLYLISAIGSLEKNNYGEPPQQNKPYYWILFVLSICIVAAL